MPDTLLGVASWSRKIVDVFMTAQSVSAIGMAQHLLADRNQLTRISPFVPNSRFELDKVREIPVLRGLGEFEARKALPELRAKFFDSPDAENFSPFHVVSPATVI